MQLTKGFGTCLLALVLVPAMFGCSTRATAPDGGALRDSSYEAFDAARVEPTPVGYARIRLVNLIPASPNLVVCLSTIAGTGLAETQGHILGAPDPHFMSDGTLPYPGVSPYLPLPLYDSPGLTYVIRLYDRGEVPFAMLGNCPTPGSITPLIEARVGSPTVVADTLYSAVLIGVIPGTPVECTGGCPPPDIRIYPDDLVPAAGARARVRLFQGIPNLPAPIDVCFDLDFRVNPDGTTTNGSFPPSRVLPPSDDTDGVAYGEMSGFIDSPPVTSSGAFFVHAHVAGVPDCDATTVILGPVGVPLPVPTTAPIEVARVIERGDVITNFAFGRIGAMCDNDGDCAATMGTCNTMRHVCQDALSPNLLPWQDVQGGLGDAGMPPPPDTGASDAGT
jgi:hypothetical protein